MTTRPALAAAAAPQVREDPLSHLPCSTISAYRKGQFIYNLGHPCTSIYLVIDGKVKISRMADGREVLVDLYRSDDFFGEEAFLNPSCRADVAVATENTKVMTWTTADIEQIVMKRPLLAVALLQIQVQRTMDFAARIQSLAAEGIGIRLARSLIRFSDRFGIREDDGTVSMIPFTHQLLAQYVGTSRELVTQYMNQFRRQGYLKYSRQGISLYGDAFRGWMRQSATEHPGA
jgi:CRP/FNR family cyclic AMP-dependent transcriptional regulator